MTRRAGRIGPYRLIAKLEQGGMAEVHLAVAEDQLGSLPLRALKVMPKELLLDPHLIEMFLDEARLAVRLNHPNVVQTMEVGEADGSHFLAMELLEGETVHRLGQRATQLGEELPLRAVLAIAMGVLQGLHYIHTLTDLEGQPLGIVHRDITPSNLYVTTAGTVKVCDFGIAKTQVQNAVTVVGMRKGKLGYLAPEQLAGTAPDQRADIYACGVVLWELVAGQRLFRRGRELSSRAPRLDADHIISPGLADICDRALAHDPRNRYPTALAMWTDLAAVGKDLVGPLPAVELGHWVERLVGEDVKNLRRLTANALRDCRAVDTLDRPTHPPEATSFTVRPENRPASRWSTRRTVFVTASIALGLALLGRAVTTTSSSPAPGGVAPASSSEAIWSAPSEPPLESTWLARSVLQIEPHPADATLVLDGELLSPPYRIDVERGVLHQLEARALGYESHTFEIDVQGDLLIQANLVALTSATSSEPSSVAPRRKSSTPAASAPASATAAASAPSPTTSRPSSDISRASPRAARTLDLADPW